MATGGGFRCRTCGEWHDGPAFAFHFEAPAYWRPEFERDEHSALDEELCIIRDEFFFIRALVALPVVDTDQRFEWGVWVSLSRESFDRTIDQWETPGREREEPRFGWLSSEIPLYEPTTLELPTQVHTQPVGLRPLVELQPSDHPLAVQQRDGITLDQVRDFNERLPH